MSKKILAVFGATGVQGGSVVRYVLNDPQLSQEYKIRAVTRDIHSEKANHLKGQVEVVKADATDRASLELALDGVHTIFAMTLPTHGLDAYEVEYNSAKRIADVAVEKDVEYLIFSTLPSVKELSGGKYNNVYPFDAKADAEKYIRGLSIKSAFYSPGCFMENLAEGRPFWAPVKASDSETWIIALHSSPKSVLPLIDAGGDTGKFIGAILAEPDKYEGETFCAAEALYTYEEVTAIMSKATGKTVVYKQIPFEDFKQSLSQAPPAMAALFIEAFSYGEEFGYYGPKTSDLVTWAAQNARGRLSTFEEHLAAHPLQLA